MILSPRPSPLGPLLAVALGSCAVAQPPAPHAATDAAPILARVRAATGTETLAGHDTGIQVRGSAEFLGITGDYSLIFDGRGRYALELRGPNNASVLSGFDGTTVWARTLGNTPRLLVLGEREAELVESGFLAGTWPNDQSLTFTVSDADTSDGTVEVAFTRADSPLSGRVQIDAATWRPTLCEWKAGASTQTLTIEEYGDLATRDGAVAKVIRKAALKQADGMSGRFDAAQIAPAPIFIRSPYTPRLERPADTAFDAAVASAIQVVKAPTGHLLVRPKVNGRFVGDGDESGWFIFDTGAGSNCITPDAAASLNMLRLGGVKAVGLAGAVDSGFYRAESLSLGAATIKDPIFITLDLAFLDAHMGRPIAGIIGFDFLSRVAARIDMTAGAIDILDPSGAAPPPETNWQDLLIYNRVPCVIARFEDHEGPFKLDTGAAQLTVTFHAPAVERLKLLHGREGVRPTGLGGVGGVSLAKSAPIRWFELGGRRAENVTATFALSKGAGAVADPYTLGNIGGKLMEPFVMLMDYGGRRMAWIVRDAHAK